MTFQYAPGNVVFEQVNLSADLDSRIALVLFKSSKLKIASFVVMIK